MKLKTIIKEDEGSIRDLMARFINANQKDSKRAHDKWMSMVATRLMDLGFVGRIRKQIMIALDTIVNQKQFDTLIAKYKLFGDYADSFRPTESTLANALKEADEDSQNDIEADVADTSKKFKLVLEIPFTTTDNKDQKLRRLKYDLSLNDIEAEAIQGINVAELDQGVLDYQAVVYVSTTLTRSELTAVLEPDYKIAKMQRLNQKPAEEDA
tara:strand:- start:912 stop:1544 length:633 start_codon:yes stop_codon:yes gene_type:complete